MAGLTKSQYAASQGSGGSPITVMGLGLGGVNLVENPLQMADNEVLSAQNADPYREQGVAGIRKRPGLQRINGSGAVGPIIGTPPYDPPTVPDPDNVPIVIPYTPTTGTKSPDTGKTFSPVNINFVYTPNAKYALNLGSTYEFAPCYATCVIGTTFIVGSHNAGKIIVGRQSGDPSNPAMSEVQVFASGSNDDTLVLTGLWSPPVGDSAGQQYCVVINTAGKCSLYNPTDNSIITLPDFSGAGLATGSPGLVNGLLWVANGTNISSIDPRSPSAWTNTAVGSIAQLLGLAEYAGNLYAGIKTTGTNPPIIVKAVPLPDGTCTTSTSIQISTSVGPDYIFGPFIRSADGAPLYALVSKGDNGTLSGTDAGAADNVTTRMFLRYDAASKWRANADVQNDAHIFNGSSNRALGPVTLCASTGQAFWMGQVVDTGNTFYILIVSYPADNWAWENPRGSFNSARQAFVSTYTWPMVAV